MSALKFFNDVTGFPGKTQEQFPADFPSLDFNNLFDGSDMDNSELQLVRDLDQLHIYCIIAL